MVRVTDFRPARQAEEGIDAPNRAVDGAAAPVDMASQGPTGNSRLFQGSQALDLFEELAAELATPPRSTRYSACITPRPLSVSLNLEDFFKEEPKKEQDSPARLYSLRVLRHLKNGATCRVASTRGKGCRIRANSSSLPIRTPTSSSSHGATASQLKTIDELVKLYDQKPPPDSELSRQTDIFYLRHSKAKAVADTVKDVFRDLLSENDKALANNQQRGERRRFSMFGYEESGGDSNSGQKVPKFKGSLSIGIDEASNALVVSAPTYVFRDVSKMIKDLDKVAEENNTVRVLKVGQGVTPEQLREIIEAIQGRGSSRAAASPSTPPHQPGPKRGQKPSGNGRGNRAGPCRWQRITPIRANIVRSVGMAVQLPPQHRGGFGTPSSTQTEGISDRNCRRRSLSPIAALRLPAASGTALPSQPPGDTLGPSRCFYFRSPILGYDRSSPRQRAGAKDPGRRSREILHFRRGYLMDVGDMLLRKGFLDERQLQLARNAQTEGMRLDQAAVQLGFLSEEAALRALGEEVGLEFVDLADAEIDLWLLQDFPTRFIHREALFPIRRGPTAPWSSPPAIPFNLYPLGRTERGHRADASFPCWPAATEIAKRIKTHLGVGSETIDGLWPRPATTAWNCPTRSTRPTPNSRSWPRSRRSCGWSTKSCSRRSSRGRATCTSSRRQSGLRMRYRIDGVLHVQPMPPEINRFQAAIISRLKIMSRLNIAERRLPQDGRIQLQIGGREVDIRVSVIPMIHGEGLVLRLLDKGAMEFSLAQPRHGGRPVRQVPRADPPAARHYPGDRPDRLGQEHHALQRAAGDQERRNQDHHHGRPGRVPVGWHQPDSGASEDRADVRAIRCGAFCGTTPTSSSSAKSATWKRPKTPSRRR